MEKLTGLEKYLQERHGEDWQRIFNEIIERCEILTYPNATLNCVDKILVEYEVYPHYAMDLVYFVPNICDIFSNPFVP